VQDNLVVREVEYVTTAPFSEVHEFYRTHFHNQGWSVADFNFSHGEWTFFVIDGAREAIVEIESRGPLVEIEIELSEPSQGPSAVTPGLPPTPVPEPTLVPATEVPPPQPVAPPGNDDDDDADDD
jgi:hypothetical protein